MTRLALHYLVGYTEITPRKKRYIKKVHMLCNTVHKSVKATKIRTEYLKEKQILQSNT